MVIDLPWPSKELSPNFRGHWAVISRAKRIYRTECWAITKEAAKGLTFVGDYKVPVSIVFYPPNKHARDLDNCLASMKSGLDGIADALKVNDHRFELTVSMAPEIMGLVKVTIFEDRT